MTEVETSISPIEQPDSWVAKLGSIATAESLAQEINTIEDVEHSIHSLLPRLSNRKLELQKQLRELETQQDEQ
jgi:prefoldin subunit 5